MDGVWHGLGSLYDQDFFSHSLLILGLCIRDTLKRQLEMQSGGAKSRSSLFQILVQTWHLSATLPHDTAYAILVLISPDAYEDLRPECTLSTLEVSTSVTEAAMESDRSPSWLWLGGYAEDRIDSEIMASSRTAFPGCRYHQPRPQRYKAGPTQRNYVWE